MLLGNGIRGGGSCHKHLALTCYFFCCLREGRLGGFALYYFLLSNARCWSGWGVLGMCTICVIVICNEIAMASYEICHREISCESSNLDTRASDQPSIYP
jgi:hypothetical protein